MVVENTTSKNTIESSKNANAMASYLFTASNGISESILSELRSKEHISSFSGIRNIASIGIWDIECDMLHDSYNNTFHTVSVTINSMYVTCCIIYNNRLII